MDQFGQAAGVLIHRLAPLTPGSLFDGCLSGHGASLGSGCWVCITQVPSQSLLTLGSVYTPSHLSEIACGLHRWKT
jgi:hypothetical protein